MIYTIQTSLTQKQVAQKTQILKVLTGNGKPEKMEKDAEHVFEASRYCGYFITTDERILQKKSDLHAFCEAIIVRPNEFLEVYDACAKV